MQPAEQLVGPDGRHSGSADSGQYSAMRSERYPDPEPRDFTRSAKIVLNLVKGHLMAGQQAQAEEVIRVTLCQASEVGHDRLAKLYEAFGND